MARHAKPLTAAELLAMPDEDIVYDEDSPITSPEFWEGAVIKENGVVIGHTPKRGKQKSPTKQVISIRLSPEVLEAFKATGKGWQTRVDNALKDWLATH